MEIYKIMQEEEMMNTEGMCLFDGNEGILAMADEKEREKLRRMSYIEATDYILLRAEWSEAFRNSGWKRNEANGTVSYVLDRSSADRFPADHECCASVDRTILTASRNGRNIMFRRCEMTAIWHDDGTVETIGPVITECHGDEAMDRISCGVWSAVREDTKKENICRMQTKEEIQ